MLYRKNNGRATGKKIKKIRRKDEKVYFFPLLNGFLVGFSSIGLLKKDNVFTNNN